MADAAEAPVPCRVVGVEHRIEVRPVAEVGVRDDPAHHRALAAFGLAGDEGGLTDRREGVADAAVVGRAALDEHGVDDVVPAAEIGFEICQPIWERASDRPEMVMRIDDRCIGIDDVFDHGVEPLLASGRRRSGTHLGEPTPAPMSRLQPASVAVLGATFIARG